MFLLFDIGGTNTRIGLSPDGETIAVQEKFPTAPDLDGAMWTMGEVAARMTEGREIVRAVGGVAGALDRERAVLAHAPNLPFWNGAPLRDRLQETFRVPVTLENDAAMVGLGEAVGGAGRGGQIVAFLTISTGVGGARIVSGAIDNSVFGFEPGQHIMDLDRSLEAGTIGYRAETLLSGRALTNQLGKSPTEITDPAVWEALAFRCAVLVHNTMVFWSPDVVVLGGQMITGSPAISLDRVRTHVSRLLEIFPESPRIEQASLRDIGGLYGALILAKRMGQGAV